MRYLVLAVVVGCAPAAPLPAPDMPTERPPDHTRHYTIWLGGARIGTAVEHEKWTAQGMTLARTESLRFLRGDAEVALTTSIVIDASTALRAQRVRWTETGAETRAAEATRRGDAWQLSTGGSLDMAAVPAELVPLLVRRDGRFTGSIFLPARGFVGGSGRIEPVAPDRLIARIVLDGAVVEATIDLDRDRTPARIVDGEGVIAMRATEKQAREPFDAVDLIAATAIPIEGTHARNRIVLDGNLALPPLPGQHAQPADRGLVVDLSAQLAGELPDGAASRDRTREIKTLVDAVKLRIRPDLAVGPVSARDAHAATAGDCTTFALAYAAIASERGIATRVVTGLRVEDNERLIRHRWAISWTGTRWIAIDAAFGHAPAGGNLIGLAVHDANDAGLVAGEAALTQVRAAHWAD